MAYQTTALVRFAHVDAAGIVFYPRYFEMVNGAVEDFFEQRVGVNFHDMHLVRGLGVPTVKIEGEFVAPSRLGDLLNISLNVLRVGNSSAALGLKFTCKGEMRLSVNPVLVCMDLATARPQSWPDDVREGLVQVQETEKHDQSKP
jgi:4-hydroxybenzoyl-CoA thioesterase